MYFSDSWSFIVKTDENNLVPVDLQEVDDWGDIEPVKPEGKPLFVTLGKEKDPGFRNKITSVWEYHEDKPFEGKFVSFYPITMETFVRRLLDAGVAFHGQEEEHTEQLKKHYGV